MWLVLGVFAARFLATAIAYPQVDGDLTWQRWLGRAIAARGAIPHALGNETFTAPGTTWVPQEWLFSLVAARATSGIGWSLFAGGVALAAVIALGIAAWHACRRGASARAAVFCTAFAGVGLFQSFGVRVQVVAWPLLALYLLLLDIDGPWAFAAIGVAALWSNVHASAMLAPVLALLAVAGAAVDERGFTANVRRRTIIAFGSAVAICCNPFGWGLPRYALGLFASPIRAQISEWRSPDLGDFSFAFGALPLLIFALVYFANRDNRRTRDLLVLGAFAFLVLGVVRNVALFGLVALPLIAPALTRNVRLFANDGAPSEPRTERVARFALPAISAVLAIVVAIGLLRNDVRHTDGLASRAVASVESLPGERRLFCADFAWCGLAVGVPHVRVFLDGRADPYPLRVWTAFDSIARLRPDWRASLSKYGVDTIVVGKDAPLDEALALAGTWRISYADKKFRVWTRLRDSVL